VDYRIHFIDYLETILAIAKGEMPASQLRWMQPTWEALTIEQAEEAERIMQMLGVGDAMD